MGREIAVVDGDEVDTSTGEVIEKAQHAVALRNSYAAQPLSFAAVVTTLMSREALDAHKGLMNAYDEACAALISDNDVQVEGEKQFKKKTAWKKLARHFHVDTQLVEKHGRWFRHPNGDMHYEAEAVVRGIAPWGQTVEEFGGCSTLESRFQMSQPACPNCGSGMWDNREKQQGGVHFRCKRYKSGCPGALGEGDYDPDAVGKMVPNPVAIAKGQHDCIATAVTRATNRAVSALVAMGEVSAEEVEGGDDSARHSRSAAAPAKQHDSRAARNNTGDFLDQVSFSKKFPGKTWRELIAAGGAESGWVKWAVENSTNLTSEQKKLLTDAREAGKDASNGNGDQKSGDEQPHKKKQREEFDLQLKHLSDLGMPEETVAKYHAWANGNPSPTVAQMRDAIEQAKRLAGKKQAEKTQPADDPDEAFEQQERAAAKSAHASAFADVFGEDE